MSNTNPISVTLSAEARLECASLVYSKWAESYDNLKKVKTLTWESAGKFCPKGEWPLYHKDMLEHAEKEFTKWSALKAEVCKYSPLVMGE